MLSLGNLVLFAAAAAAVAVYRLSWCCCLVGACFCRLLSFTCSLVGTAYCCCCCSLVIVLVMHYSSFGRFLLFLQLLPFTYYLFGVVQVLASAVYCRSFTVLVLPTTAAAAHLLSLSS
ncbi:hypothetical protein MAM1_0039d02830 [Mucor ambiguus]|uniref:Uncharacterized protein n=1 Tax=Mucor ambiguus TaxID=91626 RepID=A0A0C9MJP5_9FUNG|nr:hypothetical protein MAM1_0039d02830 [Mucor ambiguus]